MPFIPKLRWIDTTIYNITINRFIVFPIIHVYILQLGPDAGFIFALIIGYGKSPVSTGFQINSMITVSAPAVGQVVNIFPFTYYR